MSGIELADVCVTLDGAPILRGVSAEVAQGEWVGLVGPNGAGKSTLLRAVVGLAPWSGRIVVLGDEARALSRAEVARRIAFLPQEPITPAEMSVADYVLLGRTPYVGYLGGESARDVAAAVAALERLDLLALARRRLGTLSGGERQRAVLARAVAQQAPVLLLDEPTAALDVGRQQQVLELVDALRREASLTVVAAMHDLTLAGQYADRLLLLDGGRVAASGVPAEILTEELVGTHYGANVRVVVDADGGVSVVPARGRGRMTPIDSVTASGPSMRDSD